MKKVVFDIGDVLMFFKTHELAEAFTDSAEDAALLHREMFDHPDWIALNRDVTEEDTLRSMKKHIPPRLHGAAEQVMRHWDDFLFPNGETNALAEELYGLGCELYILSNVGQRYYAFRERIPALHCFRGAITSWDERVLKPDPEIYRRRFSRFGLSPGRCFFIDDNQANIEAARWCGMKGCLYRGGAGEVRSALRRAGIPIAADRERAAGQAAGAGRSE